MHILIVEDERKLAALLRRVLTEERHNIDLAYDGAAGLDLMLSASYDAVILDVMLPGLDGIEACRQLRAQRITTPVLMLTARGAIEDRVRGLNSGADDYLVKPFAMEELLARVSALLRRRDREFKENTELRVGDLTLDLVRHEARRSNQIIDHVWRYDMDALSNVVDIYIHYLRDKVDQGFTHSLIKTVRGVGYKIDG